jgi:hypothetical protein
MKALVKTISLFACLIVGVASPLLAMAEAPLLRPTEKISGDSQQTLTVKWWQWAASFQYDESPVADRTGARCGAGQEGEIWFLAGTYESRATRRTCQVPAGKTLFFPLINYMVMPQNCGGCLTCEQATATARRMTEDPMGLFVELDGKPLGGLDAHRLASPACFNLGARAMGGQRIEPTASDGYWVALRPLPPGQHTLRFGGSLPSLRQELIYTLVVDEK